jgi:hypothetical protein
MKRTKHALQRLQERFSNVKKYDLEKDILDNTHTVFYFYNDWRYLIIGKLWIYILSPHRIVITVLTLKQKTNINMPYLLCTEKERQKFLENKPE